ncbi:hypothetical protein [Tabrizicola caldifontis]|uniref:hypothetical protein n=1 Tax=Tabrizicola caldifontis TaxID=2528036 RepID=UPI00107FE06D|nr:hypothetical protein [Rhodobacter sp. YIM 73028]
MPLDPGNLPRQHDLGVALERVGDVKLAMGYRAGAMFLHQETLLLPQSMVAADPTVSQYRRDTAFSLMKLAVLHVGDGNPGAAEPLLVEGLRLRTELAGAQPDDIALLRDLSYTENELSSVLLELGRNAEALDRTAILLADPTPENREALAILEEMEANGTLPAGYEERIAGFRRNLGLPTRF